MCGPSASIPYIPLLDQPFYIIDEILDISHTQNNTKLCCNPNRRLKSYGEARVCKMMTAESP